MVNYLSRDYFLRFHLSTRTKIELFPRTVGLLRSLTNQVKVTLYYDTEDDESLYSTVADLLGEYRLVNPRITVQTVITCATPALAQKVKAKYNLSAPTDKNLVIFDCEGKVKMRRWQWAGQLRDREADPAMTNRSATFRRKPAAFLGEMAFTAALLDVTSPRPFKAYFLQGHGEHQIDSGDEWPVISSSLPSCSRTTSRPSRFRCSAPIPCRRTAICW